MSFVLAHLEGGGMPRVVEKPLASGAAFVDGALLVVDANDDYAECGADPVAIAAVALSGAGADASGFNRLGKKEFPPGMMQGVSVRDTVFHAEYVGTLPAAAGGTYGVVKGADGKWRVDFAEVTVMTVKLVGTEWTEAPLNRNRVLVRFLAAAVQII